MASSLKDLKRCIDAKGDSICVAVFAPRIRIPGYTVLAREIADRGHLAVFLHSPNDELHPTELEILGNIPTFRLRGEKLKDLEGVDVLFVPENTRYQPPRGATVVAIYHSLPEWEPAERPAERAATGGVRPYAAHNFDYITIGRKVSAIDKDQLSAAISNVYPPALISDRRDTLDIVPSGHPKIDYLVRSVNPSSDKKYIMYCPTTIKKAQRSDTPQLATFGIEILRTLISTFKEFQVVLRPYPGKRDAIFAEKLIDKFPVGEKPILDLSRSGIDYFKDAAVVVTDSSSAALSFTLATGRPFVSVDLSRPPRKPGPVVRPISLFARTLDELVAAVSDALNVERWRERIASERDNYVFRPGTSCSYLAENVSAFAKRVSTEESVPIERRPWTGYLNEEECEVHLHYLRRHLGGLRGKEMAAFRSVFDNVCEVHGKSFFVDETISKSERSDGDTLGRRRLDRGEAFCHGYLANIEPGEMVRVELELSVDREATVSVALGAGEGKKAEESRERFEIRRKHRARLSLMHDFSGTHRTVSVEARAEACDAPVTMRVHRIAIHSAGRKPDADDSGNRS